jgi:hypothetical protein
VDLPTRTLSWDLRSRDGPLGLAVSEAPGIDALAAHSHSARFVAPRGAQCRGDAHVVLLRETPSFITRQPALMTAARSSRYCASEPNLNRESPAHALKRARPSPQMRGDRDDPRGARASNSPQTQVSNPILDAYQLVNDP